MKQNVKRETNSQLLLAYQQDIEALKKELELAKENGWAFYNENNQVRGFLEGKLQKLTEIFNSRGTSDSIVVAEERSSNLTVISSCTAGDLVVANRGNAEVDERVLSMSRIKFDSSAVFAQTRLVSMRNHNKKLIEKIDSGNKSLASLKNIKGSVRNM